MRKGIVKALVLIFSLALMAPEIVALLTGSSDYTKTLFSLFLVATFSAIFRQLYWAIFTFTPVVLLAPWESYYIWVYGQSSSSHLIAIIDESNAREAANYLEGLGYLVMLSASLLVLSVYSGISAKKHNLQLPLRVRHILLCSGGLFVVCVMLAEAWYAGFDEGKAAALEDRVVFSDKRNYPILDLTGETYPFGLLVRVRNYSIERRLLEGVQAEISEFRFGAQQRNGYLHREIHILVVGESSRPDRWQLNGYPRLTTPRLSAIDGVVSFQNMVSSWAWTSMSVPAILTRKPPGDMRAVFKERSLISAYREAGFHTYWLSTQGVLGQHDSSTALYAYEADQTKFLNPVDYRGRGEFDGVLLGALDEVLGKKEQKQFIVMHTMGSHFNYADRYPEEFSIFRPALHSGQSMHDRKQKELLNNAYDNSILYTDYMLSEIIERLRLLGVFSTVFYVSDHGENLFDESCTKSGHGHATVHDFRTAAFWWGSDSYRRAYPEKVENVLLHTAAPVATYNVFHSMLDLARIEYPGEDLTMSLFSDTWKARPRPLQNGLLFDSADFEPVCKTLIPTRP